MKKITAIFTAVFLLTFGAAFAQQATDDFSGSWKTDKDQVVVISKKGTSFSGTAGAKNTIVLKDVTFSDGKWKGTVIKPGSNDPIPCELFLKNGNLKIIARKGMFSKLFTWIKVKQ